VLNLYITGDKFENKTYIIQYSTIITFCQFQVKMKWKERAKLMISEPPYIPFALHNDVATGSLPKSTREMGQTFELGQNWLLTGSQSVGSALVT
jgi:hypothetical protein